MRLPTLGCCRSRMEGIMGAPTQSARETVISGRVTPEGRPMLTQTTTFGDSRLPARFWTKVRIGSAPAHRPDLGPCWEWTGSCTPRGYSQFWLRGRLYAGHRISYEALIGPIPHGLQSDHLCRNRPCIRPTHTEPITGLENIHRGNGHGHETHCPRGHPYSGTNLYVGPRGRKCRACSRHQMRQARGWGIRVWP